MVGFMLPFDEAPLGPLRPSESVLPGVMARGRQLRNRRRLALTAPVAAAAAPLLTALTLALTATGPAIQHVQAGAGRPSTVTPVENPVPATGPAESSPNTGGVSLSTPSAPGEQPRPVAASGTTPIRPGPGGTTPSARPTALRPGSCDPNGIDSPPHPACWATNTGPRGNDVANPTARGCVVHNAGAYTFAGTPGGFFCSYDAIAFGGYTANGQFNIIRITRGGRTIDINGFTAPRCAATGLIHPGDHVYIDGRTSGTQPPNPPAGGYLTASVGDAYHC
ncbi:MAG: hypothetical protein NVSMB12_13990 [Acidimicrobiales bacterium]